MDGKIINSIFVLLLFAIASLGQIASGGSFNIEKSVMAGGGGESTGGGFTVAGTSGQNAVGTSTQNFNFFQIGGFWSPDQLAPTSALVSVSGRVTSLNGNGIRNAIVTLNDVQGSIRTAVTGSLGYFRFTDVEVGRTYVLQVSAKRFRFLNPPEVVNVNEELTNIDFTAGN